jgi:hypothetical protein
MFFSANPYVYKQIFKVTCSKIIVHFEAYDNGKGLFVPVPTD